MTENSPDFKHLIGQDPFGLLSVRGKAPAKGEHSALISSFEEIVTFTERQGRPPTENHGDILEYQLFKRLENIRTSPENVKILKPYDLKSLLQGVTEISLVNVIKDDVHGLLQIPDDDGITNLKFVKKSDRINPSYLARRKNCREFSRYVESFKKIHEELGGRKRKLVAFTATTLSVGNFYVLGGLLIYLESFDPDSSRERYDGRTRCIFENGTESDMLYRSLVKAMQVDGYSVSEIETAASLPAGLSPDDQIGGYIYVLKTFREDLRANDNLFKIGHTTTTVQERIKGARDQATYLFADVEVYATFRVANVPSIAVEKALHVFFDCVRLDVEINVPNEKDAIFKPREWFNVKFTAIEEAIGLILAGKDHQYIYDARIGAIIKRPN